MSVLIECRRFFYIEKLQFYCRLFHPKSIVYFLNTEVLTSLLAHRTVLSEKKFKWANFSDKLKYFLEHRRLLNERMKQEPTQNFHLELQLLVLSPHCVYNVKNRYAFCVKYCVSWYWSVSWRVCGYECYLFWHFWYWLLDTFVFNSRMLLKLIPGIHLHSYSVDDDTFLNMARLVILQNFNVIDSIPQSSKLFIKKYTIQFYLPFHFR